MNAYELLRQGAHWLSAMGEIPIAEMTHDHRENSLNYLLMNAGRYEREYTAEEICRIIMPNEASIVTHPLVLINRHSERLERRRRSQGRFIRSTPLYHALWQANYAPSSPPTPLTEDL